MINKIVDSSEEKTIKKAVMEVCLYDHYNGIYGLGSCNSNSDINFATCLIVTVNTLLVLSVAV